MQIFSDFKDYYDVGLKYGTDPSCVFSRTTSEFHSNNKEDVKRTVEVREVLSSLGVFSVIPQFNYSDGNNIVVILFAGSAYLALNMYEASTNSYTFHYTADSIFEHIKATKGSKIAQLFKEPRNQYRGYFSRTFSYDSMKDAFEKYQGVKSQKIVDLMHLTSVPIISYVALSRSYLIRYNPRLRDVSFFKVVDPYTAYQELSMFISGVLGGTSPMIVQVSDVVRLEKHGFDRKLSFRKEASQKDRF